MFSKRLSVFWVTCFLGFAACIPVDFGRSEPEEIVPSWKIAQYLNFKKSLNLPQPSVEELSLILGSKTEEGDAEGSVDPNNVGFYIYTKDKPTTAVRLYVNDTEGLEKSGYQKSYKTKFLVHGFLGQLSSDMIQDIRNNFLSISYEKVNVIAFDWSAYTLFYVHAYEKALSAGGILASFFNYLVREGTAHDDIHCIGHSLGAHACGFAGNQVQHGLIARITGLDPAQPGFDVENMSERLNTNDARFVDCIHTCAGMLGITEPICTADYYPNSGSKQPGCPWYDFGSCSHGRSHQFFAESILPGHLFPSAMCASLNFQTDDCVYKGALMGYPANEKHTGILYTRTSGHTPFALNWTKGLPE